ncbi:MAG: hypothetical protein ABI690_03985 [Chloroflexota bacterium]
MTTSNPAPARLFVLLARTAPVGVILRRGPSDWVQMIHWNTRSDVFTPGQWFHGRIYEHKSDLSPNGKLFVYDAYKPWINPTDSEYGNRWTAVSKPPYFTALGLWTHKSFQGGGGHFNDDEQLLVNFLHDELTPHPDHRPKEIEVTRTESENYMKNSIRYHRMLRDGWKQLGFKKITRLPFWFKGKFLPENDTKIILQKWVRHSAAPINLMCEITYSYRTVSPRGSRHKALYEIVPQYRYSAKWYSPKESPRTDYYLSGVTWADFDYKRRPVMAKDGKIFTVNLNEADELIFTELADFNANQPEAIESPAWAKKW